VCDSGANRTEAEPGRAPGSWIAEPPIPRSGDVIYIGTIAVHIDTTAAHPPPDEASRRCTSLIRGIVGRVPSSGPTVTALSLAGVGERRCA
jgi:hypothetical protein